MITASETKTPRLVTALPGPKAKQIVQRDAKFMSPSFTRDYPLVAKSGHGAMVEDVDGNVFLDFAAGIAVCSTGHCHPKVVAAIQKQAAELIHMSGTDFYYESLPSLAERLGKTVPGSEDKKVFFTNSGTEAIEGAEKLENQIFKRLFDPSEVAGIIIEPIQGEGGYVPAPKFFLQELQRICRQHGIMFIVDEVQSGMGRTGKWWASDHAGIEPDILCCAKGIASGMPLGAIIARESVMRWKPGAHGTTFGGNPVCLAAALATMDLIENEYMESAHRMGNHLFGRLADWTKHFKIVGDVRGRGLMIGIEIVRDQQTKEKAADLRNAIVDLAFHKGLLVLGAGENTFRLSPPLLIDQEQADFAARTLEECFREAEKKIRP